MAEINYSQGSDQRPPMGIRSTPWMIDKSINLPFLLTVLSILGGAVAFATKTDARLNNLERTSTASAVTLNSVAPKIEHIETANANLETNVRLLLERALKEKQ